MVNKNYLDRTNLARKKENRKDTKAFYNIRKKDLESKYLSSRAREVLTENGKQILRLCPNRKNKYDIEDTDCKKSMAIAYHLMSEGEKSKDIEMVLMGAKVYEKFGRGYKAIPRLVSAYEKSSESSFVSNKAYNEIEKFIKRNQKKDKPSTLENSVTLSIASVGVISGLLFSATNITGNVIGSSANINQDSVGLILLGVGLIALFVYKFRNKSRTIC